MITDISSAPIERIGFREHWDTARHMYRNYPVGVDAAFDRFQQAGPLGRLWQRTTYLPLYFLFTGQGWTIRDERGEMAAILYLRRFERQGVRTLHVDDIEVDSQYRRKGLAQRLLGFADATARAENRAFITLAVTVRNLPAVTLYRKFGYHAQHNRFFVPTSTYFTGAANGFSKTDESPIALQPLQSRAAAENRRVLYNAEVTHANSSFAPVLVAHYPPEPPRDAFGLIAVADSFAVIHDGLCVGHIDLYKNVDICRVRFGLFPDLWGGPVERATMLALFSYLKRTACRDFSLTLLSIGHHATFKERLATDFGLHQTTAERMLMIKQTPMEIDSHA